MASPRNSSAFFRFSALSAAGWLLDFGVLLALVLAVGIAPLPANVVSASLAASMVFLVSRRRIHGGEGAAGPRLAAYLAYVLALILLTSGILASLAELLEPALGASGAVPAAKLLVTPPQLVLNFLVSRELSRRTLRGSLHG